MKSPKRIIQINVTANSGSTGRIAEGIGIAAQNAGYESWIAYGRKTCKSSSNLIRIGTKCDFYEHGIECRLFDNHGLASRRATRFFLKKIEKVNPDLIHLHNIHGYYINYKKLFEYIHEKQIPVIWTLHDCWPFTGHCAYFSVCDCNKWKSECSNCPQYHSYPASFLFDRSKKNFEEKKKSFNSISDLTIVSVSQWLDNLVSQSFLKEHNHIVIHNGIDTEVFAPCSKTEDIRKKHGIQEDETILLGVANVWTERKGLQDFLELSKHLSPKERIILIGLTRKQIASLPQNIIGLERTESTKQLANYYSVADLFLNLTYEDNYPTTNLEAISCGTPCLTYQTGGSTESISKRIGAIVEQGNIYNILNTIQKTPHKTTEQIALCRNYALQHFNQVDIFKEYVSLYDKMTNTHIDHI